MPHSVMLGIIGANDITFSILQKIVDENIIPEKNIFIASKHQAKLDKATKLGVNSVSDNYSTLIKSEIIIIGTTKNNLQTVLAPISGMTRGKLIISTVIDADASFIQQRVAKGTHIITTDGIKVDKNDNIPGHLMEIFDDIFK